MSTVACPTLPFSVVDQLGTVEVHGEVDILSSPALRLALDRALGEWTSVVVDLRPCSFLDCSGLALLVAAHERSLREGVDLEILCGADDPSQLLFDLAVPGLLPTRTL